MKRLNYLVVIFFILLICVGCNSKNTLPQEEIIISENNKFFTDEYGKGQLIYIEDEPYYAYFRDNDKKEIEVVYVDKNNTAIIKFSGYDREMLNYDNVMYGKNYVVVFDDYYGFVDNCFFNFQIYDLNGNEIFKGNTTRDYIEDENNNIELYEKRFKKDSIFWIDDKSLIVTNGFEVYEIDINNKNINKIIGIEDLTLNFNYNNYIDYKKNVDLKMDRLNYGIEIIGEVEHNNYYFKVYDKLEKNIYDYKIFNVKNGEIICITEDYIDYNVYYNKYINQIMKEDEPTQILVDTYEYHRGRKDYYDYDKTEDMVNIKYINTDTLQTYSLSLGFGELTFDGILYSDILDFWGDNVYFKSQYSQNKILQVSLKDKNIDIIDLLKDTDYLVTKGYRINIEYHDNYISKDILFYQEK